VCSLQRCSLARHRGDPRSRILAPHQRQNRPKRWPSLFIKKKKVQKKKSTKKKISLATRPARRIAVQDLHAFQSDRSHGTDRCLPKKKKTTSD
jgi:hypothetical protein